ncbi:hypothetical protein, partial [Romboutsia ilealis]|uniref:hypothetical protein n=1 Tax=Romboutsia ilealis TaxID=1115758 RepID=UPI0026774774
MKKIIIFINVIFSLIFMAGCSNNDIVLNTDEEILQYLNESDFMESIGKENLSIIDTIQIDDSKIVTFLSNTGQGYIVCEKNEKGNYIMTDNMAQGIESNRLGVSDFIVRYNLNDELKFRNMAYIVISNGSNVSNVEISVNDRIFNDTLKMGQPSMVLLNLRDILSEDELEDMVDVNCRYFDIYNN